MEQQEREVTFIKLSHEDIEVLLKMMYELEDDLEPQEKIVKEKLQKIRNRQLAKLEQVYGPEAGKKAREAFEERLVPGR